MSLFKPHNTEFDLTYLMKTFGRDKLLSEIKFKKFKKSKKSKKTNSREREEQIVRKYLERSFTMEELEMFDKKFSNEYCGVPSYAEGSKKTWDTLVSALIIPKEKLKGLGIQELKTPYRKRYREPGEVCRHTTKPDITKLVTNPGLVLTNVTSVF